MDFQVKVEFLRHLQARCLRRNSASAKGASGESLAIYAKIFSQIDPKNDASHVISKYAQNAKLCPRLLLENSIKMGGEPQPIFVSQAIGTRLKTTSPLKICGGSIKP